MITKFRNIKSYLLKSKDEKTLVSNFSYLFIMQITSYIFPLLTIPYLAHKIGIEGFGKIAFAAAVIVWFQTITDWGFSYTATRDVARNRDDFEKISEIFSNVFWSKLLLALISFLMLFGLTELIPYFKENQLLLFVTFLLVPGRVIFADWFFQAMEKMKFITFFDVLSKTIFTLLIFIYVNEKKDFILQPLFLSLGSLLVGLASLYIICCKWGYKILKPNYKEILFTVNKGKDVFINNIVPNFYNSFSAILLGFTSGVSANGILDAGTKFSNIAQQFNNIISKVFFPFLSRKQDKHSLYAKIDITISILFSILVIALAPLIIDLFFPPEFYSATYVLQISSLSLVFLSLNNIYGLNYMIINGYERKLRNINIYSSLIGLMISIPLIKLYSFIGAVLTITISRGIIGLSVMYVSLNIKKVGKK